MELCRDFSPKEVEKILHIECGGDYIKGNLNENFRESEIIVLEWDSSFSGSLTYNYPKIESRIRESNKETSKFKDFDLIICSSTVHKINSKIEFYNKIRNMLSKDGVLVSRKGHKNCYKELRKLAKKIATRMGYEKRLKNWKYPISYQTEEMLYENLKGCGFSIEYLETVEEKVQNNIFRNYSKSGLKKFNQIIEKSDWQDFRREFIKEAERKFVEEDICSKKIYSASSKV